MRALVTTLAPITLPYREHNCFKSRALVKLDRRLTHRLRLPHVDLFEFPEKYTHEICVFIKTSYFFLEIKYTNCDSSI